jgi:hypothetical protein
VPSFFNNQKRGKLYISLTNPIILAAPRMQQPPMGMAPRGFPPFGQMGMPGMRPPFTQQPMNHAERLKKVGIFNAFLTYFLDCWSSARKRALDRN